MNNQKKIFITIAEVLEIKKSLINENSSSDTLKNWDSLAMINIIIELEKNFNVKFNALEIANLQSLKIIKETLRKKGVRFD